MNASPDDRSLVAIVDDDEFVCRAMRRLVLAQGLRVQTFTSSRAFAALLEIDPSFRPDCVILDLYMPGLDGLEVQQHVKANRPGVPVVFLTPLDETDRREQALAEGALAVFDKPLHEHMEAFVETVAAAAKR